MRVLLAVPPGVERLELYRVLGIRAPPLGLAWIGAVLEQEGHKVKIVDSPTLGLSEEDFLREVKSFSPDIVGITSITPTILRAYRAVEMLKENLPDVPIVAGGPHVTFMYDEALDRGVDVVVRGEGEYTMLELVNKVEKLGLDKEELAKIKGIAFRKEGRTVVTPLREPIRELDKLPPPARHLLPMDRYTLFNKPIRLIHVMASRGCPYGCIYCSTSYYWGRSYRIRSAKVVADEVEEAVNRYKSNIVVFTDDEFTLDRRFVLKFAEEVKSRKLDITYSCGARVDHVDSEVLRALKESGCVMLYFGVESGSQETLNRIGKRITIEQVRRAFSKAREHGIETTGTFMLGFPWETIDDMRQTVKFSIELSPGYAQYTVVTPYPGTPLYGMAKSKGLIEDWNWENWTTLRPVMRGYHFTREEVKRMLSYAYRKFYGRLSFIWKELRSGRLSTILTYITKGLIPWIIEIFKR